jgi:hypothetical protein
MSTTPEDPNLRLLLDTLLCSEIHVNYKELATIYGIARADNA